MSRLSSPDDVFFSSRYLPLDQEFLLKDERQTDQNFGRRSMFMNRSGCSMGENPIFE